MRCIISVAMLLLAALCLSLSACAPTGGGATPTPVAPTIPPTATPTVTRTPTPRPVATLTPTPTPAPVVIDRSPTPAPHGICAGMSGFLEVQILVGPAEAVGLAPHAVGNLPFSFSADGPPYRISGSGAVEYADVLSEEWGTYTVSLAMQGVITGECVESDATATLNMHIELSGDQLVEVNAEDFQGSYPWSGTHAFDLAFPAEEGATASGEGWSFVLHLSR